MRSSPTALASALRKIDGGTRAMPLNPDSRVATAPAPDDREPVPAPGPGQPVRDAPADGSADRPASAMGGETVGVQHAGFSAPRSSGGPLGSPVSFVFLAARGSVVRWFDRWHPLARLLFGRRCACGLRARLAGIGSARPSTCVVGLVARFWRVRSVGTLCRLSGASRPRFRPVGWSAVVGELQRAEVGLLQQGDDGLEVVALLAGHPELVALDRACLRAVVPSC